jgi:CRP-like cAMP-binding protein
MPFKLRDVLYEARQRIDYVYFSTSGIASAVAVMEDGGSIEVGTIGREGMVGLPAILGDAPSPNRVIIQVAGDGLRMPARALREAAARDQALRKLLIQYQVAFLTQISQTVACNGLHTVQQRCCRWLLMTQDRVQSAEMGLTHEFLAIMLGVRRPTVSEVLKPLQARGLLRSGRGRIKVLDRTGLEAASCECYQAIKDEYIRVFDHFRPAL